jgi:hypothetical protein
MATVTGSSVAMTAAASSSRIGASSDQSAGSGLAMTRARSPILTSQLRQNSIDAVSEVMKARQIGPDLDLVAIGLDAEDRRPKRMAICVDLDAENTGSLLDLHG